MLDALSRSLFLALAGNQLVKRAVSRYGMRSRRSFARRFIAGRDVDDALETAMTLERGGFEHTFNHLGEHVKNVEAAAAATSAYEQVIEAVRRARLPCHLSVKLTQLGLELDPAVCRDNLDRILRHADTHDAFVRIDMENSTDRKSVV